MIQFARLADLSSLACGESETTRIVAPTVDSVASSLASLSSDPGDGFCYCGCGGHTPIARMTRTRLGHVKGSPIKFLPGHNMRSPEMRKESAKRAARLVRFGAAHPQWRGTEANYYSLHTFLRRAYPKTGTCEWCSATRATDWANVSGNYTRDRVDYAELCRPCHGRFDKQRAKRRREECAT